ncbi:homoserine dehydrogenase [Anaerosinus massiliensis]|uniref:homoserine dehydrogenase n=1 Tax=Massilibacillus massiliensis TaxID=1806837 RepID=UPI000A820895|nr:homoserine dehydrogenase [Massilibacillus massiliensis]
MKKNINIGLLGLGTVGGGVLKVLKENAYEISQKVGGNVKIKKVLVRDINKKRTIEGDFSVTSDVNDIINDEEIDIVIEVMGGENPAKEYMLRALNAGKHVVTANKDVVAKFGREMFEAAKKHDVDFMFEASVGGGIPIITPLKQCLTANKITEVMGIVNGTTNYMLTKMTDEKMDYNAVLAEAQEKGYAEADPTADVEGLDAARKITILSSIAFNTRVGLEDVYVEGITKITPEDIEYARELGYVIKLLAIAKDCGENGVDVRVHPVFISKEHPLAAVSDVFNAIFVKGNAVGETMFYGRGAGEKPTASAVVGDVIDIARNIVNHIVGSVRCTCFEHRKVCPIEKTASAYYVRLLVEDEPGVLATIAGVFGRSGVSLNSVIQTRKVNNRAEIVLITHNVAEENLRKASTTIKDLSVVSEIRNIIRVETPQEA